MQQKNRPGRPVRWLLLFALLLCSTAAAPVLTASATDEAPVHSSSEQMPEVDLPSEAELTTALREGFAAYQEELRQQEEQLVTPAAIQEREASRHAYANLTPEEAEGLLRSRFGSVLEQLNKDSARYLSDARLEDPAGTDAATVTSEGETTLFEADAPVRTRDEEGELRKVDVSLVEGEEGWEPVNPLVELQIGEWVDEGIEIGEAGVGVTQIGAENSLGRLFGDKNLFYGEVSEGSDMDLLVSPTAAGAELFNLLRSVDSPETLSFHVEMPVGAALRVNEAGAGEVVGENGDPLILITKPAAFDAQGTNVPVSMTVEGNSLVLELNHREEDVAYPILVDPELLNQNWGGWYQGQNLSGLGAFGWQTAPETWWVHHGTEDTGFPNYKGKGLFIATAPGELGKDQWGQYTYSAPNENSYLADASISPFWRNNRTCPSPNPYYQPYDYAGMWNGTSYNRLLFNKANEFGWVNLESWGRMLAIGMSTNNGTSIPCWRDLMIGGVSIWLDDWQSPVVDYVGPTPEGWVKKDGTPRTFSITASDAGLGVRTVRMFGAGTQDWYWSKPWCAGTYEQRCPNSESGQITFKTEGFPYEGRYNGEGKERKFTIQAIDPTDERWGVERPLWLDGVAPTVELKGQLASITKQVGTAEKPQDELGDNDELGLPTYNLEIEAQDGADRSGVKEIKVFLDGKEAPEEVKSGECSTNCPQNLVMNYTLRLPGLTAGTHSLRVVAVDKVGNESDPTRNITFEYIPATGMKDEFVLQHFRLPDGNDYSGEAEYHGPEIAVNVINGNVIYHERDVEVETDRGNLELERVYNSQQPAEKDTQWGRGWSIAQAPELEPQPGSSPPQKATVTDTGEITASVPIPQIQAETTFSSRLHASITKTDDGYEVEPVTEPEVSVFDSSGRIEEVVQGDNSLVYLEPEGEEEVPAIPPTHQSSFGSVGVGSGQLREPAGIAVDSTGNLWVVDSENDRLQKFNAAGEYQGSFGASGTGNGQFERATDVAIDAAGNLWVTDRALDRVQKFNAKGEFLTKYGSSGAGNGQFNRPEAVAIDPKGNIWIADTNNSRLQKFNAAFEFIKTVGTSGGGQGQLSRPTGIDIGPGGSVWVADWDNNRVSAFDETGQFLRQFGSAGSGNGQFARPNAIEVDSRGNVWVGDQNNHRIQQFNQKGEYLTQFGSYGSGKEQFSFGLAMGIASDSKGNLWVSDTYNHRVQRWQIPSYTPTYHSAFGSTGTGSGQLKHPAGIAVDEAGSLWVVDQDNDRLQRFNAAGEYQGSFGTSGTGNGQFGRPTDVAVDAAGNLWVTDAANSRLQKFNAKGEFIAKIGSLGSGSGQFNGPESVAIDTKGNVWVADTYNGRLQKFSAAGAFIQVVGIKGTGQGQLFEPTGIDIAPNGNVWVADWGNNRISIFSENGEFIRQFGSAGGGDAQFARPDVIEVDGRGNVWVGDQENHRIQQFNQNAELLAQFGIKGTGAGQFNFGWPMGIASDYKGNLWVSDTGNNRVQRWRAWDSIGESREKVPAPYFTAPVVDYEYAEGKLTALQLEDESTQGEDPSLEMTLSSGLVTDVDHEEGDTTYGYQIGRLRTVSGADGQTQYGYDIPGRLKTVALPNGTTASIAYDATGRAATVTVDPAGAEPAKTTHFSYSTDPRRTTVWGGGNPEITYDIGEDGSVLKWAYAETPPTIASISGSLWSKRGEEIENKDHTLFVTGSSPHQVASIKVIANGNSVVAEKTCEDPASPPSHVCDQPGPLEWITHPSEHAPGRMDLEVVVTDFLGHQTAERFLVVVPQPPPPDPEAPARPTFDSIQLFREENGLDRSKSMTPSQLNELILELLYDWERRDETAMRAVEGFGVPMRAAELSEMEYRRAYLAQAAEAIPQWAEENAPSTYGGYYVDNRAGGVIHVGFTENQHSFVEALKQSGELMASGQVTEMPTPPNRSIASVEATESSVAQFVISNASVSAATTSISTSTQSGLVEVTAINPDFVRQQLTSQFGSSAPIVVIADTTPIVLSRDRFNVEGPVVAGDYLVGAQGDQCTAAFSAQDQVDSVRGQAVYAFYKMTAGHCFHLLEGVSRRSRRVGGVTKSIGKVKLSGWSHANSSGNFTDVEMIDVNGPLAGGGIFTGNPHHLLRANGASRARLNREYCWSGFNGGKHCGTAFKRSRIQLFPSGKWEIVMAVAGANVSGDSGGPVWDPKTERVVGIVSAHGPSKKIPCHGVTRPGSLNPQWCPINYFAPLLPFHDKTYPEGALKVVGDPELRLFS